MENQPGATPVAVDDGIGRVVPVIEALQSQLRVPISINMRKPGVMRVAIQALQMKVALKNIN
ncbi:MAG: dihydropteroate synthase [Pseudomonadota bacterium]|nr:dihydropteroate synthase [Pseudomonadota bacterium]